jgi:hypothetical protein
MRLPHNDLQPREPEVTETGTGTPPRPAARPKVVTVSGPYAGVGKTRLVERLLAALPGAVAVKVRPSEAAILTCEQERAPADPRATDTQRYLAAGAAEAYLLQGPVGPMLARARELIRRTDTACIVFETNALAEDLAPDLALYVDGPGDPKPGASACRDRAHVVVSGLGPVTPSV